MKSVIISAKPKWCEKIASCKKTIEVRKTAPKEVPFKAYIYCTYGNDRENYMLGSQKKIIGEFICDKVDEYHYDYCDGVDIDDDTILDTAIDREDINIYAKGKTLYGWHISKLKIYDNPIRLSEFERPCPFRSNCHSECLKGKFKNDGALVCSGKIARPPQSWQYVEKMERFSQGV